MKTKWVSYNKNTKKWERSTEGNGIQMYYVASWNRWVTIPD